MQIDLGGLGRFVTEPQRDDGCVDAGVQQRHRRGVAQGVRGDVLGCDRGAGRRGAGGVFGDQVCDRVAAQRPAGTGGKQRVVGPAATLGQPDPQDGHGLPGQRGSAIFTALSRTADVRAGA